MKNLKKINTNLSNLLFPVFPLSAMQMLASTGQSLLVITTNKKTSELMNVLKLRYSQLRSKFMSSLYKSNENELMLPPKKFNPIDANIKNTIKI